MSLLLALGLKNYSYSANSLEMVYGKEASPPAVTKVDGLPFGDFCSGENFVFKIQPFVRALVLRGALRHR
eukprot:2171065-Pyramimonas_sp.AAC.1